MPSSTVQVRRARVVLPTFEPAAPQKHPFFLERRVYQGSSGRVYPLPVIDRIAERPTDRAWDAVYLENEYLEVMILPQIGGRIHAIRDKTNGYDLIYRQPAIKPALVGLAGPWLSGGIELNWPQHHRPATFMPVEVAVEAHPDGAKTVWLGDHDPLQRMKGMHGVRLRPSCSVVELRVRVYNRTTLPQTFLWWANVAVEVHEAYQSFFPPDVHSVADHAKRAMSAFPWCRGRYYGVNYAARARRGIPAEERPRQFVPPHAGNADPNLPRYAPNDLSWYANIPVPTSYMAVGSAADFFGGYDHRRRAGIVHVASHHIAPGKKQWTWGNQEFGYAWDRNLTVANRVGVFPPYIELMAGVYTDNQPDFSFLRPGETKAWSQCWYPIRDIGPPAQANSEAAISLQRRRGGLRIGIAVTRPHRGAELTVDGPRGRIFRRKFDAGPHLPFRAEIPLRGSGAGGSLGLTLRAADGAPLACCRVEPESRSKAAPVPLPAVEPPPPKRTRSADELYLIGAHLEQYRHATRDPAAYWREALRRDPGDARCNHALGAWHLRRGEFADAERHLRAAIARLTERNPNPDDCEPFYTLGVALRLVGRDDAAYEAFHKAAWSQASQPAAYHALAEIDCTRHDWGAALEHLDRALRVGADNLRARNLKAMVLRRAERPGDADSLIAETLALDPLDAWARELRARSRCRDPQIRLDLAHDYARAGFLGEAAALLEAVPAAASSGVRPLLAYTAAWLWHRRGRTGASRRWLDRAAAADDACCFPARLEEHAVLSWAVAANPRDGKAWYLLGNWLYDRRRREEAIRAWERATRLRPAHATSWRNLAIGAFNVRGDGKLARRAYERAVRAEPADARLLYERDQLWKRLGTSPAVRLAELERHRPLVAERDDFTVEYCALLNLAGRPRDALSVLSGRRFQPWEGGEGQTLGQYVRARLTLGREALAGGDAAEARRSFAAALSPPDNLGEAWHPLASTSEVSYLLGEACAAAGDHPAAREHWKRAAAAAGDFREMAVRSFSETSYFTALAWERLGGRRRARRLLRGLLAHARRLSKAEAGIDYFATSLPTLLLFEDDLQARQAIRANFLEGLALLGLGERARARSKFRRILAADPSHAEAAEFLRRAPTP